MSTLSRKHESMLLEESGLGPSVVTERSYETIKSRADLLDFKKYQRRAPALRVPMFSPDGITRSAQLRPDNPRVRDGKAIKYETAGGSRCILDVHPRMQEQARSGDGDLWITEGIKKADSLTSRGLCTVGLIGVWNWQRKGEMLLCWDHVRLDGRRVYIVFDSDVMTKHEVQLALERLVAALEERGAEVLVVYLPHGGADKTGVDDYLVAGGTVNELKMLSRKFEPSHIGNIRMIRDEKLRAGVEDLERRWWLEEWKGQGGHSDRDIALNMIESAARNGKVHSDGIRVKVSWGVLQVGAKISRRTLAKGLSRLQERGFCYRDNEGRKADKIGAFVLRANVDQYGSKATPEGKVTQGLQAYDRTGLHLRVPQEVPRLRWSRPAFTPRRGTVTGTRRVRESKPPLPPRERIERLGKVRGSIVDALEVAGGKMTLQKLCEVLHRSRPRDVRRRVLPMLEDAGIIEQEEDVIRLARDWREELEAARETGGEVEADELAEDRRKRKSRAYHRRHEDLRSEPSAAGLMAVRRSMEKRSWHLDEAKAERKVANAAEREHRRFVKRFVRERLRALGQIRLGLLQEILKDAGGTPGYALPAAKSLGCTIKRLAEFQNEEFVLAPEEWVA